LEATKETVTIKDVTQKPTGWYDIVLEGDDRVLSTKASELAEVANAAKGGSVEVEFTTKENGRFTNHYLESVGGSKGTTPRRKTSPAPISKATPKRDDERIARQWAYGRAVELLIASDTPFNFPLSEDQLKDLAAQADALLNNTRSA
jgi:hypothetical protein